MSSVERVRIWSQVAAAPMGVAGIVHAAAAGQHAEHRVLAYGFAAYAVAQVGWAVLASVRPSRRVAGIGLVLAGVGLVAWAVTRTVAVPAIGGLEVRQPVGTQDLVVVVAQAVAALAAGAALLGLGVRRVAAPAVGLLSLAFAVPAVAAPHTHDEAHDIGHDDHTEVDHTEVDHTEVDHTEVDVEVAGAPQPAARATDPAGEQATPTTHAHGSASAETPSTAAAASGPASAATTPVTVTDPGGHSTVPARPASAEELARAAELVASTKAALEPYRTTADAEAAGYRSIGDARTGFEHFVHSALLADGRELDPANVESLVYRVESDGSKTLVSGMYILETGKTLADVPNVGGPLTVWHDHQNLCWDANGRVVGLRLNGSCVPRGTFRPTPPMLHVWVVDNPCGPFAGVEGRGPAALLGSHGDGCATGHN